MKFSRALLPATALAAVGLATLAPAARATIIIQPVNDSTVYSGLNTNDSYGYGFALSQGTYTVNDAAFYIPASYVTGTSGAESPYTALVTVGLYSADGTLIADGSVGLNEGTAVLDKSTGGYFYEGSLYDVQSNGGPIVLTGSGNTSSADYYLLASDMAVENNTTTSMPLVSSIDAGGLPQTTVVGSFSYIDSAEYNTDGTTSPVPLANFNTTSADTNFVTGAVPGAYFGPSLDATYTPAPEPSGVGMIALMGLGLGGLVLRARRTQGAAA